MTTVFQALAKLELDNQAGALCMVVHSKGSTPRHTGSKMLVFRDGSIVGTVGGGELENRVIQEALSALVEGEARLLNYSMGDPERGDPGVCGGQVEVYVEPVLPKPTLVVIGSGHVGKAVVHLAKWLDFFVVVNDDRPNFATPETAPGADLYLPCQLAELPEHLEITPWTYLVLTTRGVNVDIQGLPALLESQAAYIGVIGSQRRWAVARKHMLEMGITEEKLRQVHSPIGLELNAETPEEIALSILAEILMLRNRASGKPMRTQI